MKRTDLAEATGLSYAYLSDIEGGRARPSSKSLVAIAEALGMPAHELMRGAEDLAERIEGYESLPWQKPTSRVARDERTSWFDVDELASPAAEMASPEPAPMAATRARSARPSRSVGFSAQMRADERSESRRDVDSALRDELRVLMDAMPTEDLAILRDLATSLLQRRRR
jgi:transcriptional regulator with XRE-family HTH domain